jgi:DNA helicase II / ATP-dependent DNA helicase PcrA
VSLVPGPPSLSGDAFQAVESRGTHIQIIAAAGSGKTEVVSQRVVSLLAEGVPARSIVAFTFTERAASELKERISERVEHRLGRTGLDQLTGLFVGTIHAYCFRLLQQFVPKYETFDVLDQNQLTAFLSREAVRLDLRQFDPAGRKRLFASIEIFQRSVDIVENETIDPSLLPQPFRSVFNAYIETLEKYRLLTYGQQVGRTVSELQRPEIAERVHADLRHLIVDEYQDVNPAQERLIRLLAGPGVELCVVGDDDQAIYQWRGSDVGNIVGFANRYEPVKPFQLLTNRRSRPTIISAANEFALTIPDRLSKVMDSHRDPVNPEVVVWRADDEQSEVGWLAQQVLDLVDAGVAHRDIGVLVRTRAAYPQLLDTFATFDIPVQAGGRTGLFDQPEAALLGRLYAWLVGFDWRNNPWDEDEHITKDDLLERFTVVFGLAARRRQELSRLLDAWKEAVPNERRSSDLVGDFYELLDVLDVRGLDLDDRLQANRIGTLARFSFVLTDYESVRRRARVDTSVAGEQVGGQDRGEWLYKNLAIHLVNYANGAYEAFDGEPEVQLDAVDVSTVHAAKGLEWPAVFIPSVTANRFPSSRVGRGEPSLVPAELYNVDRYAGSDADERRLFYVAMTRARDFLSVSRHARVTTKRVAPSPYWGELAAAHEVDVAKIVHPTIEGRSDDEAQTVVLSFSELASFMDCGLAFRLRTRFGFQPRLAPELGYGKAVHHVMRQVAEHTHAHGAVPTEAQISALLDANFFLPGANKAAHAEMKGAARRLVTAYVAGHPEDLFRVWLSERPFELRLEGVTVAGRADVILDREGGTDGALAIVDYKTSARGEPGVHDLQLQVYADAGRREGLDVRAAYVHDLKLADRSTVDVASSAITTAEQIVIGAADQIRRREFDANPGTRCRRCEVRTICPSAK